MSSFFVMLLSFNCSHSKLSIFTAGIFCSKCGQKIQDAWDWYQHRQYGRIFEEVKKMVGVDKEA